MKLPEPIRWLLFFAEWALFAMTIPWGLDQAKPTDFRDYHWHGLPLILALVVVVSVSVWSVYRLFPSILHTYEAVGHTVATITLLAAFASVVAIAFGTNARDTAPDRVPGVLVRYEAARGASHASDQGHYGRVRLVDGREVLVERVSLNKHGVYVGADVQLIIHRGRYFDWGELADKPRNRR